MDKNNALMVQEAIDRLNIVRSAILNECGIARSTSSLCNTCRKSNICNPHNNYKVQAIECLKYIQRKV